MLISHFPLSRILRKYEQKRCGVVHVPCHVESWCICLCRYSRNCSTRYVCNKCMHAVSTKSARGFHMIKACFASAVEGGKWSQTEWAVKLGGGLQQAVGWESSPVGSSEGRHDHTTLAPPRRSTDADQKCQRKNSCFLFRFTRTFSSETVNFWKSEMNFISALSFFSKKSLTKTDRKYLFRTFLSLKIKKTQ